MPDGSLPTDAVARYKEFGDWIRACYGTPVASTSGQGATYTVSWAQPLSVDRVVITEAQEFGELVRAYTIYALVAGTYEKVSQGSAVGNKRIDVWREAVATTSMRLVIDAAVDNPQISFFGVYDPKAC